MCAHKRYRPRIQSLETNEGGIKKSEARSASRIIELGEIAPRVRPNEFSFTE